MRLELGIVSNSPLYLPNLPPRLTEQDILGKYLWIKCERLPECESQV